MNQAINKDSKDVDVADYVGDKLQGYQYAEEVQKFIVDQSIDGETFLNLTDDKLKSWGLSALGKREELLALVDELRGQKTNLSLMCSLVGLNWIVLLLMSSSNFWSLKCWTLPRPIPDLIYFSTRV
eukprot:TRINITY_DN27545_c0_g1_i9.p1 TRINITY_DN27545_c0_g1~~TRINITY_DN27545_c0_g1_i9.p1  ORF type:complete len:126 (-),score=27.31 TRINITY_DN27545_c0_g1_i9:1694-2071(-)